MKANRAGKIAEDILAAILMSIGIALRRQVVVGRTVFDTDYKVDFVASNFHQFPLGVVIESKWQDVGGTADEKYGIDAGQFTEATA